MAVYASLVSLMTVIDHVQQHPCPPITLNKEQVESLCNNITFLQEFLEAYPHRVVKRAADGLETRIAEAAHAAEDVIESHIVDQILGESKSDATETSMMDQLYQSLQKVLHEFESLKEEVKQIPKTTLIHDPHLLPHAIPAGSVSRGQQIHMVGFEDVLLQVLDKLTGHECSLQIVPIVGMGGIGKTTLAKYAYENQLTVEHFQFRSWVTVSQEYNVRNVLSEVLSDGEKLSQKSEQELGESLYKSLWGRKYLVIIDDIWSLEAWDRIKRYFPNNSNGSRIIITSRMSNIGNQLSDSHCLRLNFLSEEKSWELLCKNVFGEEVCPVELEIVGRQIAKNCRGLPLSIAVISGLLARSTRTREYWEYVTQNVTPIVNAEEDKHCSKILSLSYNHLPIHLKPCFLYMGVFPEDYYIKVSTLMKLWVAEGFLKPRRGDSLKVVAEEYLKELIDRNLISVKSLGYTGIVRSCQMHDLLRDLCIKIGVKEKFIHVLKKNNVDVRQGIKAQRCIVYHGVKSEMDGLPELLCGFAPASPARSLIADFDGELPDIPFRLLRVLNSGDSYSMCRHVRDPFPKFVRLVNSRFISVKMHHMTKSVQIPPSLCLLWNLQTIRIYTLGDPFWMPSEIWMMPQLEHIIIFSQVYLPDPPQSEEYGLWNLQTLSVVAHFKCSEQVVQRIPNIRKLKILFPEEFGGISCSDYCMSNLCRLLKLEYLCLNSRVRVSDQTSLLQGLNFLHGLKTLRLYGTELEWEDITRVIGSLPFLQVLELRHRSTKGFVWNSEEGKFCCLKFLGIYYCDNLKQWMSESNHFPCLEYINLFEVNYLEEIPLGIGEIPTLRLIEVQTRQTSLGISVKKILEEQEELGNFGLQIEIT